VKTITVGQLRQNPTAMLAEVEAGEIYRVTRRSREIARIIPRTYTIELVPRKNRAGSRLAELPRHDLRTATSIDQLLADERDR
jgi:prevent-host-death family protein